MRLATRQRKDPSVHHCERKAVTLEGGRNPSQSTSLTNYNQPSTVCLVPTVAK